MSIEVAAAYARVRQEGADAYALGKDPGDNPYEGISGLASAVWDEGWEAAQDIDAGDNPYCEDE